MSFKIRNIVCPKRVTVSKIYIALNAAMLKSRFTARIENHLSNITIHDIRLIQSKDYCGNHPLPCPVRPWQPHKDHIHSRCLEGADWVAFNDMLNDVLDKLQVSANVASSLVIIRKGVMRCVQYNSRVFYLMELIMSGCAIQNVLKIGLVAKHYVLNIHREHRELLNIGLDILKSSVTLSP